MYDLNIEPVFRVVAEYSLSDEPSDIDFALTDLKARFKMVWVKEDIQGKLQMLKGLYDINFDKGNEKSTKYYKLHIK